MKSQNPLTAAGDVVLYCAGCNERFQKSPDGRIACPRCGADAAAVSRLALDETFIVCNHGDPATGRPSTAHDAGEELDQLIGADLGMYHIQMLLGCGGMGRVYLAQHKELHRNCALKILSPKVVAHDVDYVARFRSEGRAAAALVHPNIITIHAVGVERGYHFLEMEFVAGCPLQQLIDNEGRLPPVRATALTAKIAQGLAAAHRENIIHGDLKPDNVLLTHDGIPKIADFGLAKRILGDKTLTDPQLAGTPHFMAPELFQNRPATRAADVYALGVCYYLLLTGQLPFTAGKLNELIHLVTHEPPPSVRELHPEIPLEMAEALSLLMAKTPENRPGDGIEAAQLLAAVLGQVRDIESLLKEAFRDTKGVAWIRCEGRYRLELTLPDGRRQVLFIEPSDHPGTERLLLIYSICCAACPDFYEQALRLNSELQHGGLAIREIDGEAKFIMVNTYPRATVDPEEVRQSVLAIAFHADAVEKQLTGLDHH